MVKIGELTVVRTAGGSACVRRQTGADRSSQQAVKEQEHYRSSRCEEQWYAAHELRGSFRDAAQHFGDSQASRISHSPKKRQGPAAQILLKQWRAPRSRSPHCKLFLTCWLIVFLTVLSSCIPLQTKSHRVSVGGSSRVSTLASDGSGAAGKTREYMKRFNVPAQNIDIVWLKSGGSAIQKGGKTYHFQERRTNVGVYAGYAPLYDSSAARYCERTRAQVDTVQTVGHRLMASGACPNWGKIVAFTDSSGRIVDINRWNNEIHGSVMPHSTEGCPTTAAPGSSEVAKREEGMAMYSGYMASCPFNQAVYEKDMLPDGEYDPVVCDFVTLAKKLVFLDTKSPSLGNPYTPYAFHGSGGHRGYDYSGETKQVGCPPYKPPKRTSAMKDRHWLADPFDCSRLSRCTTHCWPYAEGSRCFRSVPAVFNVVTKECRLLGYHTQYFQGSKCAGSPTDAADRFYCVKPVKTAQTSSLVYLTAHMRPDYETQCPPREPLLNVQWGRISSSTYCQPMPEAKVIRSTTAEGCGQAVFENSSADDVSLKLGGLHWGTFVAEGCADMNHSCRGTVKGRCLLYSTAPDCLLLKPESMSFTSLTAVDPSIAKEPDKEAVLPSNQCADVECGNHGTCSSGTCLCDKGWEGDLCDIPACVWIPCQNNGVCDRMSGECKCSACYDGDNCEIKKPSCCETSEDCGSNRECDPAVHACVCLPGYTGYQCETEVALCEGITCSGTGTCDKETGRCVCEPCRYGNQCQAIRPKCCRSDADCENTRETCDLANNKCVCAPMYGGPHCQLLLDGTCRTWCTAPNHVPEKADTCDGVDCIDLCCKGVRECSQENNKEDCYSVKMEGHGEGGRCCVGKGRSSKRYNCARCYVLFYLAAGGTALLVVLLAAGAAVTYTKKKPPQATTSRQFVEFDAGDGASRGDEGPTEEAIEVNLEDFQSDPQGISTSPKKVISTTWDR